MPDDKPEVKLTFVPTGEGPPFAVRVRLLLKRALRVFGLRCTKIEGNIPDEPTNKEDHHDTP